MRTAALIALLSACHVAQPPQRAKSRLVADEEPEAVSGWWCYLSEPGYGVFSSCVRSRKVCSKSRKGQMQSVGGRYWGCRYQPKAACIRFRSKLQGNDDLITCSATLESCDDFVAYLRTKQRDYEVLVACVAVP